MPVTVLVDAPEQYTLANDVATSKVQIAKTGRFKDPRYGTFSITLKDFSKWIANFQTLNREGDREGLPVDIDHGPEKSGNTEAAGWVTALSIKDNELWAAVEWNSLGKELVSDRRYKYLSPSYVHNYKDETGKEHGTALVGVALTNRPFLTMATVNLSGAQFAETLADEEPSYSQETMPDFTKIAQALKLAEDADEATILAKVVELGTATPSPVSLEDQAKAEGKFILTADRFAELSQQASEGSAAAKTLAKMTFETKFQKCLSDGKVIPAQKDLYSELYDKNPEQTVALLDSLTPVVNVTPTGAGGGADSDTATLSAVKLDAGDHSLDDDTNKLHELTVKLMSEQKIDDYAVALEQAMGQLGVK